MQKSKHLLIIGLALMLVILAGCGSTNNSSQSQSNSGSYQNISGDQLKEKIQKNEDIQIIDVRTAEEFAAGHIKSAVNLPLDKLQDQYTTIKKDKVVVLVCASGARSASAADFLVQNGYDKVINLNGGLSNYSGELVK